MRCATANVQGLSGKHQYIEQQMVASGYDFLFLQETKTKGGSCTSQHTIRVESDYQQHWGTAVWIAGESHKKLDPIPLAVEHLHVVKQGPRLIAVMMRRAFAKFLLVSVHFPQQGRHPAEREVLEQELHDICVELSRDCIIIVGTDANARLENH